ncbi:MAG: ROK family protein [Bacteroidales bacterium]|nr:ROK family protein [Bacteroidales bacterium]
MTLDAGGTNFVFSAVQGEKEIIKPVVLQARGKTLEDVLRTINSGFLKVKASIPKNPVAISFSFPGPAEFEKGIIGDLENLPTFRGGVALGAMLEDEFNLPVFINNDGDLFAYGEALAGFLPEINKRIKSSESPKTYDNMLGVTFGTGFGGGIVNRGELFMGDNSAQGEINRMRNRLYPGMSVEESISIRGVQRVYARESGIDIKHCPEPRELYEIGIGKTKGDKKAALKAFEELAIVAGDALANAITLVDGLIVIGGGLSGAHPLFLTRLVEEMNSRFKTYNGSDLDRLEIKVFNLEDEKDFNEFYKGDTREITVPFSNRKIKYDPLKRIGIGVTRLGTSLAVHVGAYDYALNELDRQ